MAYLRPLLLDWNYIQTDIVFPLNPDHGAKIDAIYTEVLISDERQKSSHKITDGENIENITLDKIFTVQQDKPARFIFLLGEAGYGKTVLCQKITKSWCQAWNNENIEDDLVRRLKEFDLLFFVKMRYAPNNQKSLIKIIQNAYSQFHISKKCLKSIKEVLTAEKGRCLVILDGLDEWNISNKLKKKLVDRGLPNCRDMPSSTILITMRSWKFMEVKAVQLHCLDRFVRIRGLDEKGIEAFSEKVISNCLKIDRGSIEYSHITQRIQELVSKSHDIASLLKIPLLAFICIITSKENVKSGYSLTTFYISILEALMKRSQIDKRSSCSYNHESVPMLEDYWYVQNHMKELSNLGKVALSGLTSRTETLTFRKEKLNKTFNDAELDIFFRIGVLIKSHIPGQLKEDKIGISFIHKTMQEFLAAFSLWREGNVVKSIFHEEMNTVEKVLELSMVLKFISGLSPDEGCEISRVITGLTFKDKDFQRFRDYFSAESYEKVFHIYNLQLMCYREVRNQRSIKTFQSDGEYKFSLADIILHGKDTDQSSIRETADVLLYHINDIKSLQMKFVPDDRETGITNEELNNFLENSESIESLNIEGYVDGQCRIFGDLSIKMSNLRTLGLHHIAVPREILTNIFTKSTERKFEAIGLFNIRHSDDPKIPYEFKFSSDKRTPRPRSGFERKKNKLSTCESSSSLIKKEGRRQPILIEILTSLPSFHTITTFHSAYMESFDDRQMFLQVLPKITNLTNVGYIGSSNLNVPDDKYDLEVVQLIMKIKQLRHIGLCDIIWKEEFPKLCDILNLEEINLQDVEMDTNEWSSFVTSVVTHSKSVDSDENRDWEIRVVLTGTNIDVKSLNQFKGIKGLMVTSQD